MTYVITDLPNRVEIVDVTKLFEYFSLGNISALSGLIRLCHKGIEGKVWTESVLTESVQTGWS